MRKRIPGTRFASGFIVFMFVIITARSASSQSGINDWGVFLSLRETRQFDRTNNDVPVEDRIADSASTGFSYSTRTEHSSFVANGRVGVNVQRKPETNQRERLNYGGGLAWNYQPSARSQMRLSQRVSKNIRLETLSNLGVLAGNFDTLTATTSWSFQHQSGPRTSWNTSLGYGYREIDNPDPVAGSQIVLDEDPFGEDVAIPLDISNESDVLEPPDGENDVLRILATEGFIETNARSHRGSASFGLNHSFTQRTSLNVGAGAGYRSIDSSSPRGGTFGSFRATLQNSIRASSAISAGYTLSRTLVADPGVAVQTLFGGWSYSPSTSSLSIRLFGGASRYESAGGPATTTPVANATLSGAVTSSTTAGLSYRRQFSVPQGFGRSLLIDYLNANLAQQFGGRVSARIMAGASFGSQPLDETEQRNTLRAGATLTVKLVGGLNVGTSYFHTELERRNAVSEVKDTRKNWSIYLNFATK